MKTILEHFQSFPVAWREEALQRLNSAEVYVGDKQTATPASALAGGFYWAGEDEDSDDWDKWNDRHKQLLDLQEQQDTVLPPPLSNTNLLIGCLYELDRRLRELVHDEPYDCTDACRQMLEEIDSALTSLTPPCDLKSWDNNYPQ